MPIFRLQNDQLIALDTTRFDQHVTYARISYIKSLGEL